MGYVKKVFSSAKFHGIPLSIKLSMKSAPYKGGEKFIVFQNLKKK